MATLPPMLWPSRVVSGTQAEVVEQFQHVGGHQA
jgi:hypothetical protein